jgi:hypothetical protein
MKVCVKEVLIFCKANVHGSAATSAVDLDTDRAIQDIIRGPIFHDVTILTIAYVNRLSSKANGANDRHLGTA